jgi:hypothetical protein
MASLTVKREYRADLRPPAWQAVVSNGRVEIAMLSIAVGGRLVDIDAATDEEILDHARLSALLANPA